MIKYSYRLIDFRQWLRGFSELLHVPASNRTLTIPRELGDGTLQAAHLPDGISFLVLNFSLNDDLQFISEATRSPGLCLFFNQVKSQRSIHSSRKWQPYLRQKSHPWSYPALFHRSRKRNHIPPQLPFERTRYIFSPLLPPPACSEEHPFRSVSICRHTTCYRVHRTHLLRMQTIARRHLRSRSRIPSSSPPPP